MNDAIMYGRRLGTLYYQPQTGSIACEYEADYLAYSVSTLRVILGSNIATLSSTQMRHILLNKPTDL